MPIDLRTFTTNGIPRWPGWAKAVLFVPMLPGILLLALSLLLVLVSLAALFVLTAPVFVLLNRVLSGPKNEPSHQSPGRKRVDAVVRDV